MFKLSQRSIRNLTGVDPRLVSVVEQAIGITGVDFAVTEGLRSVQRQAQLVAQGASHTMKSKHIEGRAVDLVAYIDNRISWELNLYDDIAEAMRTSAKQQNVTLRWGAAWNIPDICSWPKSMEAAVLYYVDASRAVGKRPFIDAPHFELA